MKRLLTLILILASLAATGSSPLPDNPLVGEARLISKHTHIQPGAATQIGLKLTLPKGWHTYGPTPSGTGFPFTIDPKLPNGLNLTQIHWPEETQFTFGGITSSGYEKTTLIPITLTAAPELTSKEAFIQLTAKWLVCKIECIPQQKTFQLTLPIDSKPPGITPKWPQQSSQGHLPFGVILVFAFIGGLILNIMPCVLPVLSIKVLLLVEKKHQSTLSMAQHTLSFCAGILATFWALGGLTLLLKASGAQLGWGFQLQNPVFVLSLSIIMLILALNLLGAFEIGLSFGALSATEKKQSTYVQSFLLGLLTTLVATPCTAPFMGVAMGVALTTTYLKSLSIFTALGLGLCTPYIILTVSPGLMRMIPKPGRWMTTLKRVLSLGLFATLAWLLWILNAQLTQTGLGIAIVTLVLIGVGTWQYGIWQKTAGKRRLIGGLIALVAIAIIGAVGIHVTLSPTSAAIQKTQSHWEKFDPQTLHNYRLAGHAVFVDFTAKWCLTCQVNKKTTLTQPSVLEAFKQRGIILMQADWTTYDPVITQTLHDLNRSGVPVYALYLPDIDSAPILLPELLTPGGVLKTLEKTGLHQAQNPQLRSY